MSTTFYPLTVSKVNQETKDAVSLSFAVPDDLKDTFNYSQGQYLTLRFMLNDKEERRAYSMCSSPLEEELAVTIKRLEGGLVSNHINDSVKVGDVVDVMAPEGRFFTPVKPEQHKNYYLFGAGSGITPLMSILKTVVEKEPKSTVFLLYGNRNENSIIFHDQMEEMKRKYDNQLIIEHTLSRPIMIKETGLNAMMFNTEKMSWSGKIGRVDKKAVTNFLEENPERAPESEYFICGPNEMINDVEAALLAMGKDKKQVHAERFTAEELDADVVDNMGVDGAKVKVELEGEMIDIVVPKGKTILDVLLEKDYEAPYSCTSGSCSTCMAKVSKGKVEMEACYALDDDEVEEGFILTCQAHPTTAEVELSYKV